jgi:hypothetical protein
MSQSLSFVVLIVAFVSTDVQAQQRRNEGDLSSKRVLDLGQSGTGPELMGGKPAEPSEWPASFYSSSDDGNCSSTLIGPRTLILAAHCVGQGKSASVEVDGKTITSVCTRASNWPADASADYALCRLAEAVDALYETVNPDASRLKIADNLLLTGFGCTQPSTTGAGVPGNDGIFRIGLAKIVETPGMSEPNSIVTQGSVAICPGDSGGGAYIVSSAGTRKIVSVNSRVIFAQNKSLLSSLSSTLGKAFLTNWSQSNNEQICGLNLSGARCR